MKLLGFDTSTEACSVALLVADQIYERFEIAPRKHAELILPMIDEVLAKASMQLIDLDAIAFGRGPGSFMGVRISAGIAQGLCLGVNCPAIPVSSLQALAQVAYDQHQVQKVVVGWDARMGEIYWGGYEIDSLHIMRNSIPERLSPPQSIPSMPAKTIFVGNAWQVYASQLQTAVLENAAEIYADLYPSATAVVKIAQQLFAEGQKVLAREIIPVYLRDQVVK
jgi:tRNA threonylcarbamoyladenosine biosynthesis protein TsaB